MAQHETTPTRLSRRATLRAGMATGTAALLATAVSPARAVKAAETDRIEPNAGQWKTWVLASGSALRPPPPPDRATTDGELAELRYLAGRRDAAARDLIAYWDAGSPSYRWMNLALEQNAKKPFTNQRAGRLFALLNVAIYDATIAAWDAKYTLSRMSRPVSLH